MASNADVQGITTNGTDVWIVDAKGDKVYPYTTRPSELQVPMLACPAAIPPSTPPGLPGSYGGGSCEMLNER